MKINLKNLIRMEVKTLSPVSWGRYDPAKIRLFWGENLIQLPDKMMESIKSKISSLNQYPDPNQTELRKALAEYNQIDWRNIIVGNGSDALIELLAKTFIEKGDEVLIPQPSFITYSNVSKLMGGIPVYVNLDKNFNLDVDSVINKINEKTKIIFISNPNNPTGNYLIDEDGLRKIFAKFGGIVVVDECYYEIGGFSVMNLLDEYENLIILRSFSKGFAIAALRVGYALASEEIAEYLNRVQKIPQPFEVNSIAQISAIESLKFKEEILKRFFDNKNLFISKLKTVPKIKVVDTKTSFIILDFTAAEKKAKQIKLKLEKRNILTKDCSIFPNFNEYYLYLGIPKRQDISYVVDSIKEVIK